MKAKKPFVSIIVVNFNGKHLLKECFDSLLASDYPKRSYEIIMVDNDSTDGSVSFVRRKYPRIKAIKQKENNYCRANNVGISKAKGELVALVNTDTQVEKTWLSSLVRGIQANKKIAGVGGKILFPDGKIQSTGHKQFKDYYWGDRGCFEKDRGQFNKKHKVPSVSNCASLYRREALEVGGGFDEDFVMYMEEADLAYRLRKKGWQYWYIPKAVVYHQQFGSGQSQEDRIYFQERNRLYFICKYFPERLGDLFYGTGNLFRLKPEYVARFSLEFLNKLIKERGFENGKRIFKEVSRLIQVICNEKVKFLEKEIKDFEKNNESLRNQIEERNSVINQKDKDFHNLAVEKVTAVEDLKRHTKNFEKKIKDFQNENESLKKQIEERNLVINQKDKDFHDLTLEKKGIVESLKQHVDNLASKESDYSKLNQQIKEEELKLKKKDKTLQEFTSEIENLRAIQKTGEEKRLSLEKELKSLEEAFRKKEIESKQKDISIQEKDKQSNVLESQLKEKEVFLNSLKEKNNNQKKIIQTSEKETLRIKSELSSYAIKLDESEKRLQDSISNNKKTEAALKNVIQANERREVKLNQRKTELETQLENLNRTLLKQEKEQSQLKENYSKKTKDLKNRFEGKINEKEELILRKESELAKLSVEVQEIKKALQDQKDNYATLLQNQEIFQKDKEKIVGQLNQEKEKAEKRYTEKKQGFLAEIETSKSRIQGLEEEVSEVKEAFNKSEMEKSGIYNLLSDTNQELEGTKEKLDEKEKRVQFLEGEIHKIYSSETYRFFVKPIVWPIFRLLRKIIPEKIKKETDTTELRESKQLVSIAQFKGDKNQASLNKESVYFIKLFNRGYEDEVTTVIVDIYPQTNRVHPERHFCYFALEVAIPSRSSKSLEIHYDWGQNLQLILAGTEIPALDFWRGDFADFIDYNMIVHLKDKEGNLFESEFLHQKLVESTVYENC